MKKFISLLVVAFLVCASSAYAVEREVTLAWNHDGADLAGFKLHHGTASGVYAAVDVGMATKCVDLGITPEEYCHKLNIDIPENVVTNFYFVASAYDAETPPNESAFSTPEVVSTYDFELPPIVTDLDATFDKGTNTLSFTWTYDTEWLPKIERWELSESSTQGGPYTKVVDVPYDPDATPPYTTDVIITLPSGSVTKYYVMTTHRSEANNSTVSGNSNEVSVTIDKMPPKSPFELKVKVK
jgi:hypothetical protein